MPTEDIKAGIIGCGGIARAHLEGYRGNGATVTAVTDLSEEAMNRLAAENEGIRTFADHRELLDSGTVNVVSICTPPVAHEEPAVYALANGIHVLCEKPLAHDIRSAAAIKDAAAKSDAVFMPAFRHRFLPATQKLKAMIDSGNIGVPVMFRNVFGGSAPDMQNRWFTRKAVSGGGCLLDTSSHSVDLFRFLIGEVVEQHAVMHRHFANTDVEDAGLIIVKAENGAIGSIGSGFVLGDGMAFVDVTGREGRIVYDYKKSDEVRYKPLGEEDWEIVPVEPSGGFSEEIAHFIKVVNGEESLQVTAHDGFRCQEIIESNYT